MGSILDSVEPERVLQLDGIAIGSLPELLAYVSEIDDASFSKYANEKGNVFSEWAGENIDSELGASLRGINAREGTIGILENAVSRAAYDEIRELYKLLSKGTKKEVASALKGKEKKKGIFSRLFWHKKGEGSGEISSEEKEKLLKEKLREMADEIISGKKELEFLQAEKNNERPCNRQ